ncbi:sodium- and chloride-dependent betaine transporter-like isoform X1 [Haliotis rufescens]|uniref:sodium- and chloride-dependent betaine transporter-like isoform X1 n=2 Tax=Haliotis rufescens TaxID=6454 RepID=UPI00201F3149|nr:sodium- and chloride-dependent betaine transporter-like isoform X1 [Haliotis rufescens]XP_048247890.1 sodium- and chloride-dependent betaine transporter-like isoform X1 [Haliotis rufescens]
MASEQLEELTRAIALESVGACSDGCTEMDRTPPAPKSSRDQWSTRLDYIMSMIGYCVGFGNLWRFPYICNRNGGGAFLIPFVTFLVITGLPMFYLEAALGQFSGKGAVQLWNFCPLLKGIGIGSIIQVAICLPYYNILLAWPIYYLVQSCSSVLPWTMCGNWWNTDLCVEDISLLRNLSTNSSDVMNSLAGVNGTAINTAAQWGNATLAHTAVEEFYQYNVLRISNGIHEVGSIQWHLVACLFASYIIIFLCIFRGVKATGKIVYITALLPYILLTAILIRSLMLPGSGDGIAYYIKTDFSKLLNIEVWSEACLQVFYSLGPGWGIIVTTSSYNKFTEPTLRDSIILCIASEGTSIFAGFVTFSILGVMAERVGVSITEVVSSGPGLGFVAYPEALSQLPLPQMWSFLFFLMLLTVGLDSQFLFAEIVSTALIDQFPRTLGKRRGLVTAALCGVAFLLGVIICTQGGTYIMQLLDWYLVSLSLFMFCTLECVATVWFYGIQQLCDDIRLMSGRPLPVLVKVLWGFVTPGILLVVFFMTLANYQSPSYGKYTYPTSAVVIGWMIASLPLIPIPVMMITQLQKQRGSLKQRLLQLLRPDGTWCPANTLATKNHTRRTFAESFRYIFKSGKKSVETARY